MSQQNKQHQATGNGDDNCSIDDFVRLEGPQSTAAAGVDVPEGHEKEQVQQVWNYFKKNSSFGTMGGNGNGNDIAELKVKMAALELKNQVLETKLENQELRAKVANLELKESRNASGQKMTELAKDITILKEQQPPSQLLMLKDNIKFGNPEGIVWDSSARSSSNGLIVDMKRFKRNVSTIKGFLVKRSVDQFLGTIIYYYEVTQLSSYGFAYWVGLSNGLCLAGGDLSTSLNSYAVPRGCDFCCLAISTYDFELPEGVSMPEWKGRGDVVGCGLVVNPGANDDLAIFFTLNGTLLGKQIPIYPPAIASNHLYFYPTVTLWDVSLEANFGDDLDNKPFKYDIKKCPGLVFQVNGVGKEE